MSRSFSACLFRDNSREFIPKIEHTFDTPHCSDGEYDKQVQNGIEAVLFQKEIQPYDCSKKSESIHRKCKEKLDHPYTIPCVLARCVADTPPQTK